MCAAADGLGHLVEGEALLALDVATAVVVLPWSEEQEAALCAGIEAPSAGLGEWCEAVFAQDDGGEAGVKDGPHDVFFAWTDAGRNGDGAVAGLLQAVLALRSELIMGDFA